MTTQTLFELVFAAAVIASAAALGAAAINRLSRRTLVALSVVVGTACTAGWIAFALEPGRELALAAGGLAACLAASLGALGLENGIARARRVDQTLAAAESRLRNLVEREAEAHKAELERSLARARADSLSRLIEEERRIAEERRKSIAERERRASSELSDALARVERRVEQRVAGWTSDLERAQQTLTGQLEALAQRQRELLSQVHSRFEADAAEVKTASADARAAVAHLRQELEQSTKGVVETSHKELETHEAERRRALHEVAERLRQRERELRERITAEETEAARRIQAGFAGVERRQIDQLGRVVERTAQRLSEAAAEQFSGAVRAARDDAAKRLSRELERAVEQFTRQAQTVLAERLAQVADAGGQRLDRRLSEVAAGLERQRDEFLAQFQRRLADVEVEVRAQVQGLAADAEAERAVLDARLHELSRRLGEALGSAESGFSGGVSR